MKYEATKKYRKTKKGVLTNLYGHIKTRNKTKFGEELNFTLKEFQKKYIENYDFLRAYNVWVKSGYEYYKKPSVDRIDPDKSYFFDNMEFMTWEENRRKGEAERSRITTSVSMFDLSGKHIKDFKSIKEAVRETGLNQSGITSCCCGRYKQTGGYVFRYKDSGYKKIKQQIGNIHDNPELLKGGAE